MEIISYLSDFLSSQLNISPPAVRGLLKLSIKDELGPFKSLDKISYNDLKTTIQDALKKRLEKLEVSNFNNIIERLLKELQEHQSLITMGKI